MAVLYHKRGYWTWSKGISLRELGRGAFILPRNEAHPGTGLSLTNSRIVNV